MIWAKLHCPPKIFWAGTAMRKEVKKSIEQTKNNLCHARKGYDF